VNLETKLTCAQCQTALPPGTKFCTSCGEPVAAPKP